MTPDPLYIDCIKALVCREADAYWRSEGKYYILPRSAIDLRHKTRCIRWLKWEVLW